MAGGTLLFVTMVLYGKRNNFIKEAFKDDATKKILEAKKRKPVENVTFESQSKALQDAEGKKVVIKKAKK